MLVMLAAVAAACAPDQPVALQRGVQLQLDLNNSGPSAETPAALFFMPGSPDNVTASSVFSLTVEGHTAGGQRATRFSDSVVLTRIAAHRCASGAPTVSIPSRMAADGAATFSGLTVTTPGQYSFRATSGSLTLACHDIVVTAATGGGGGNDGGTGGGGDTSATPASLSFTSVPSSFTAGQAGSWTVAIRNSAGATLNTATNPVMLELFAGACPVNGTAVVTQTGNAVTGLRTASITPPAAAAYALRASSGSLPAICRAFTATSGESALPTAFTPNLPPGMRLVGDSDFDSPSVPNVQIVNWERNTTQSPTTHGAALMTIDGRSVVRAWFPEQHAGNGVGPMMITTPELNSRSLYVAVRLRYSPNYVFHTNGEKLILPMAFAPGDNGALINIGPLGELQGVVGSMNGPVTPLCEPITQSVIPRGQWITFEYLTRYNSPGQSDGVQRAWVDGRLVLDRQNLNLVEHTSQVLFRLGRLDFTRGGGPSSVLTPVGGQWVDVDRLSFYAGD